MPRIESRAGAVHQKVALLLFGMALQARHRSLILQIMAGDADLVSGILAPVVDLADLRVVAVKTLAIEAFLMLPMLERQVHVTHFQLDDFRTVVFRILWQSCYRYRCD